MRGEDGIFPPDYRYRYFNLIIYKNSTSNKMLYLIRDLWGIQLLQKQLSESSSLSPFSTYSYTYPSDHSTGLRLIQMLLSFNVAALSLLPYYISFKLWTSNSIILIINSYERV